MSEETKVPLEEKEEFRKRLFSVINHVDRVREDGKILINALVDEGELELARRLAEALSTHDSTKFSPIEFVGMFSDNDELKKFAINHHRYLNRHHVGYYSSYKEMSSIDIAEMVVDLKARSSEFGTDLRNFFKAFVKEHNIPAQSNFCQTAKRYIDLMLPVPFEKID